jgi:hypothetical protein
MKVLVNVHGSVTCKEKCGPSVSIALVRLAGKHTEERKSVSLTNDSDEFLFQNVAPGKYRLEVKCVQGKFFLSERYNFCFYMNHYTHLVINCTCTPTLLFSFPKAS